MDGYLLGNYQVKYQQNIFVRYEDTNKSRKAKIKINRKKIDTVVKGRKKFVSLGFYCN